MTSPTEDVYEAAARAYDEQCDLADLGRAAARAAVDAGFAAGVAAGRAQALKTAARALLADAKTYQEKWCRRSVAAQAHLDWDRGFVRGMEAAAHTVANGIDRPEWLAEWAERHVAEGGEAR